MTDVTIPADVAKQMADWLRNEVKATPSGYSRAWLDLLDPKPPTLREKVADALAPFYTATPAREHERSAADAVLAVFRAALADLKRPATVTTLDAAIEYIDDALFGGES